MADVCAGRDYGDCVYEMYLTNAADETSFISPPLLLVLVSSAVKTQGENDE